MFCGMVAFWAIRPVPMKRAATRVRRIFFMTVFFIFGLIDAFL